MHEQNSMLWMQFKIFFTHWSNNHW